MSQGVESGNSGNNEDDIKPGVCSFSHFIYSLRELTMMVREVQYEER